MSSLYDIENTWCLIFLTLGHNCHIRQFCKVSIELPYKAVLWTHFCVDRTAIYGSFMDTFFSPTKLPYMAVLWTLFGCLSPKPTKLRTLAVLWTLFGCLSPSSCLVPQNCHIWQFYGHKFWDQQNCYIWQFYGHFSVVWAKIPTKLGTLAVLWTLFGCGQKCP